MHAQPRHEDRRAAAIAFNSQLADTSKNIVQPSTSEDVIKSSSTARSPIQIQPACYTEVALQHTNVSSCQPAVVKLALGVGVLVVCSRDKRAFEKQFALGSAIVGKNAVEVTTSPAFSTLANCCSRDHCECLLLPTRRANVANGLVSVIPHAWMNWML
eukprot:m.486505 g.486505  ORF g.486505 m.486505 type:complete len:158 (-) comp21743_c1_seq39:1042-1515(-)